MYKQINIDKLSDYKSSSKWWGFLYNASESLQSMIIKTQFYHGPPPRPPPLGCNTKYTRMKVRSETMLLQVSFVGIYFYMFTKNLKTRLKGTRQICLS